VISKGTCSDSTEALFRTTACLNSLAEQPNIIRKTLELLVQYACSGELFESMPFSEEFPFSFRKERKQKKERQRKFTRLPPVSTVNTTAGTKTELKYENTRHRYPWICSLRTKGITAEHLCAVTLLSVPPQPTIIVGPAHCTYLCRDGDPRGARLQACCCTPGPLGCSDDVLRCGRNPGTTLMAPDEVVILCGEWETGPTPAILSGEKYNLVLEIREIVRHPAFDYVGLDVEGGNDLAIFKIKEEGGLANSPEINPICLPDPVGPNPYSGVQSGWSNPPPLHFFKEFGEGFLPFMTDTFKQWHYKLDIEKECREPNVTDAFGLAIEHPSVAYYPPGLICAKEVTRQFCPTAGDSGSPLMVKDNLGRFTIQGVLSFLRECDTFSMGPANEDKTVFQFLQSTESPLAYTKLSCFLPWVAEQFGLSYEDRSPNDEACLRGTGQRPPFNSTHEYNAVCREKKGIDRNPGEPNLTVGDGKGSEHPCIFPFYYKDKLYDRCSLLETSNFVAPVWRCPVRNITTKYPGTDINHFEDDAIAPTRRYCIDTEAAAEAAGCDLLSSLLLDDCEFRLLNPDLECDAIFKVPAFSTCKSDCPGVRRFGIISGGGIIGGGAVLFAASAIAGTQTLLPVLAASVLGGGALVSRTTCNSPFCRARSGQCCLLTLTQRGPRCPRSC